ncbi:hypothetical protein NQ314_006721 [Rhamnusium bicolor]|uniref:Double jelly roll-like domain-containing protein n=1 Tax=Rhamnusium bicolor TaxID=1586634 RepID=A0AAV8Z0B5_9CUCU|nr:hypothetical protein NQ314_006721 [Rhamnusium bicolor]
MKNAGYIPKKKKGVTEKVITDANGNFNVCIPLKSLVVFVEDFRKIINNMKQKLVLIRNSNDYKY